MRSDFSFSSLVALRNEDKIFTLLKKDKYFELFIAFIYKTYNIQDRKEIIHEDLLGYLRKFLKDEFLNMQANGIENLTYDNAYRQMIEYNLLTTKVDLSKIDNPKYDIVTNTYKDVVRLIEERTGNVVVGGVRHIEDTVNIMMDNVGLISGDTERRLKYLEEEQKKIKKEIEEIKKTGTVRALTKEELRANIHNIDRNISSFGTILFRGAMRCKDEQDAVWASVQQRIRSEERVTNGEAAVKLFDVMLAFNNSTTASTLKDAMMLLSNSRYKANMNYIVDTVHGNPDAIEIMNEDGIDLKARYKQISRYLRECSEQVNSGFLRLDAFIRSREIQQNRLLYKKADELLLACKEYGMKHSLKKNNFSYTYRKLFVVSPDRRYAKELKQKVKIVNKERDVAPAEKQVAVFRDLSMANIEKKFRELLDEHCGVFTLKEYVEGKGTSFGMYEFIAVKNIMTRYMGQEMFRTSEEEGTRLFRITDFAPDTGSFKTHKVMSLNFSFNEGAYHLWKKDGFKI